MTGCEGRHSRSTGEHGVGGCMWMRRVTCHPHYAHVMFPYKSWIGLLCGIAVELQAGRDKEHKCLCVCVCE